MISYRFVPISSQKGVLFFETPGRSLLDRKSKSSKDAMACLSASSYGENKITLFVLYHEKYSHQHSFVVLDVTNIHGRV